jgi:hypothetical protein
MKIDESKPDLGQAICAGDRQNRREFFNGLGKWSMIVVAAVSFIRGSGTRVQASHDETSTPQNEPQRPAWTVPEDTGQKMQVSKGPYVKGGGYAKYYIKANDPHTNTHSNHKIIQ